MKVRARSRRGQRLFVVYQRSGSTGTERAAQLQRPAAQGLFLHQPLDRRGLNLHRLHHHHRQQP